MLHIAIVEDDPSYARQLQDYLGRYSRESGEPIEVTVYTDGDEIVEGYRAQFDLILLDVEMPFLDGMTAAEEIRRRDSEVVIIFITNMAQYAIKGYAVDALRQPDIVGSIAGDDTVFVVMSSTEKAETFREEARSLLS